MSIWADPLRTRLTTGIDILKLDLPDATVDQLMAYLMELERWNNAYNLTAVRDLPAMVDRHLLDSLSLLPVLAPALAAPDARVLDVGSGPGLPGLILAIVYPELPVTVLDSNGKKARFLRHAVRTLGLSQVTVAETRVEAWAPPEPYTLVTSRAFSALADFFALTRHLLAPGGQWAAMKGKLEQEELAAVPADITIREPLRLRVPGLDEARHLLLAHPT